MHTKEFKEPSHDEIACNAYFRWRQGGSPEGQPDSHWFAAEIDLMQQQATRDGTLWTKETVSS